MNELHLPPIDRNAEWSPYPEPIASFDCPWYLVNLHGCVLDGETMRKLDAMHTSMARALILDSEPNR